ncbi:ATP phosphoribosyltransferase [Chloroflexota bacterium]
MQIKIALPKGRLLDETTALLKMAGWELGGYHSKARLYRLRSRKFHNLLAKIFQEKDIPIQVAVGNYDLGICGLDWVEELLVKYPSSALVKVKNLEYGRGILNVVASRSGRAITADGLPARQGVTRIASEYPNLAESFAAKNRLRRFSVFPLCGAAEVYPPESADLALISGMTEAELLSYGLTLVSNVLSFRALLIANRDSWETKDMSGILASLEDKLPSVQEEVAGVATRLSTEAGISVGAQFEEAEDIVRLALPDGHQQLPTLELFNKAGIQVDDYQSAMGNRRPTSNLEGVTIKVIRPQDMPLQVANDNFDLAISGRDWLIEHLYQFPSSPVTEFLDLKSGRVRIVAVVSKDLPADDVSSLRQISAERPVSFRVASEYVNIADKYARDNHLGMYRVVPTWGATEAFLPEDADLLIENTETGQTIARHNLKIIDNLFTSTACLIGNRSDIPSARKRQRIEYIVEILRTAVEAIQ